MHLQSTIFLLLAPEATSAASTLLGTYVLHRHGDRTAKSSTPPVHLTTLGSAQILHSASFFRNRYITGSSSSSGTQISQISTLVSSPSQLHVFSPEDLTLQTSAQIFIQGLYPPLPSAPIMKLANGTEITDPMGGRQFSVPVTTDDGVRTSSSGGSEGNQWLQAGSGCRLAEESSKSYEKSGEFGILDFETRSVYGSLEGGIVGSKWSGEELSYKNAYAIWDYINVNSLHNETYVATYSKTLTPELHSLLEALAYQQQLGMASNTTDPIRGIQGSILAGDILNTFSSLVSTSATVKSSTPLMTVQFSAYATFLSFFSLSGLNSFVDQSDSTIHSIPDYASSMVFELWQDESGYRAVKFYYANGPAGEVELKSYPLFAKSGNSMSWESFMDKMGKFAIRSEEQWCGACGNTDGVCASFSSTKKDDDDSQGYGKKTVIIAGVVGAVIALVVLGASVLIGMFALGRTVVKKETLKNMIPADKLEE